MADQSNQRITEFTALFRDELRDKQGGGCSSMRIDSFSVKMEGKSVVRTTDGGIDSLLGTF